MTDRAATGTARVAWDRRTWLAALIVFVLILGLSIAGWAGPQGADGLADMASLAIALLLAPPVLSAIARRRWLLWAYSPLGACFVCLCAFGSLTKMPPPTPPPTLPGTVFYTSTEWHPASAFVVMAVAAIVLLLPLVSAGPVCLVRVFTRRAAAVQLREQNLALRSASVENAWPPAPRERS